MKFEKENRYEKINRIISEMRAPEKEADGTKEKTDRKKENRILKICSAYLSIILVIAIVAVTVAGHYLGKVNFGDISAVADNDAEAKAALDKELETYLSWPMTQYVVPRSGTQAQMRDDMEVLILDWEDTTDYIHSIIFDGVKVKTEPLPQYT